MAFSEDLSQFFDTDDFAVEAVFSRDGNNIATVKVICDSPTEAIQFEQVEVAADNPFCTAKTSEIASVRRRDTATIGDVAYKVTAIKHDGTGVTRIDLELF